MKFKKITFLSFLILVSATKIFSQNITGSIKNYDSEIDQNNLMLVDATLELNEAMLAGIKASIDTLGKPDPAINGNNVKEILQRTKRAHDRTELLPYLQFMNDSLVLDCKKLRTQKEDILSRLTPFLEHQRVQDSIALAKKTQPVATKNTITATDKSASKKEKKPTIASATIIKDTTANKKIEAIAKNNQKGKDIKPYPKTDTVIVVDLGKAPEMKPAKEKNTKLEMVQAKKDTVRKATMDSTVKPTKTKSDTVLVVLKTSNKKSTTITNADSLLITKKQPEPKKSTAQKPEPSHPLSKRDSIANKIEVEVMQTKAVKDTVKKVEQKQTVQKRDTISTTKTATVSSKQITNSSPDTIQHIKSQFLLKRAQTAIAEKKLKQADEYLHKSLELWKDNYDAWMTLANQDAQYGSPVKALEEYQECVRIDSSKPKLFYNIASLYLQGKKKTEAVEYFTKTIAIDSTYLLAYMGRASILSDWKKYNEAISDYDKVLQINKSYHYAYKARGMVKQLNKRFSEAVDDFTRFLIFEETDPSAYYYRGLAKIGNNELLEGCIDLSKSAEMGYDAAEKAIKKSCE